MAKSSNREVASEGRDVARGRSSSTPNHSERRCPERTCGNFVTTKVRGGGSLLRDESAAPPDDTPHSRPRNANGDRNLFSELCHDPSYKLDCSSDQDVTSESDGELLAATVSLGEWAACFLLTRAEERIGLWFMTIGWAGPPAGSPIFVPLIMYRLCIALARKLVCKPR